MGLYPASADAEAHAAAQATVDPVLLYGNREVLRAVSRHSNTFQYYTPINGIGRQIHWGGSHASEIPYGWETLPDSVLGTHPELWRFSVNTDTYNEQDRKLRQTMNAAWVAFAKAGSPNGAGLPHWPAFSGKESYMEFGIGSPPTVSGHNSTVPRQS